ncbi:MAG: hypothetical protein ABIP51_15040 [Bacteroidia bacterium]
MKSIVTKILLEAKVNSVEDKYLYALEMNKNHYKNKTPTSWDDYLAAKREVEIVPFPFKAGDRVQITDPYKSGNVFKATIIQYPGGFGYKNDNGGLETGLTTYDVIQCKMKKIN